MMTIEKLNPTQYAILREICKSVSKLGGSIGLLAAIGSWGDTLTRRLWLSWQHSLEWSDSGNAEH